MAGRDGRTSADVRRDIETERDQLATAVDDLKAGMDVTAKLRSKLPIIAAGALAGGFFIAGGIGATMRLLARRGREGTTKAKAGRFAVVDRDD